MDCQVRAGLGSSDCVHHSDIFNSLSYLISCWEPAWLLEARVDWVHQKHPVHPVASGEGRCSVMFSVAQHQTRDTDLPCSANMPHGAHMVQCEGLQCFNIFSRSRARSLSVWDVFAKVLFNTLNCLHKVLCTCPHGSALRSAPVTTAHLGRYHSVIC